MFNSDIHNQENINYYVTIALNIWIVSKDRKY